ncbi:MAG TPA: hypothetical protein ENL34_10225 [Chloroflexi bacterium]|nr:hypothetical protein [Chloroflexota bacterium]
MDDNEHSNRNHNGINIALQTLLRGQEGFGRRVDGLTTAVAQVAAGQDQVAGEVTLLGNEVRRTSARVSDVIGEVAELKVVCAQRGITCNAKFAAATARIAKVSGEVAPLAETTEEIQLGQLAAEAEERGRQKAMAAAAAAIRDTEAQAQAKLLRRGKMIRWALGGVGSLCVAAIPFVVAYCGS